MNGFKIITNFDKFMSRKTLMTIVCSESIGDARLVEPKVRKTDKMFLKPKS